MTESSRMRPDALLEVSGLKKYFPIQRGLLRKVVGHIRAVDDVSFFVRPGETLSLVGESGCGKTTTARCVLRAVDPTGGEVLYRAADGAVVDVAAVPRARLRPLRREMQMIFQDPFSSLNSRMTLLEIVGEPLEVNGVGNRQERTDRVAQLLRLVGLRPEYMRRYPHAFSGGQRQRIGIARALALNPRLVVADEPVSALDVSVQAQILNLMLELQERLGLTYLFVAHDLSVVKHISDRVAVMYVGQMVELAETEALFSSPKHPYTAALLSAIPEPDPATRRRPARGLRSGTAGATNGRVPRAAREARPRVILQGEVANPAAPPSGCYFHPRCQYAIDVCRTVRPVWEEIEAGHFVRCHRARELQLPGISGVVEPARRDGPGPLDKE
jgi:peptide/nickel transport system ATP-binding protein